MTRLRDVHPKKKCIVWYALADGQTKLYHVKHWKVNDKTHVIRKMKKDMEDFVRYHYIINTKANNGMLRTIEMCAVYKKEGAPRSSPEKVTVLNKTHGSAVLRWEPLPVSQQRGFLTNYMIYISGSDRNETANVSWLQTNFTLQNLKHGTTYTVRLAGKTAAGVGPNTTKIFQTNPEPRATKGLSRSDKIITAMCLIALSVTALCSFIIKCFKGKLLPTVPSPVIPETPGCRTDHENESYPVGEEEVDSLILLPHVRNESSRRESQEEGNSVEFCETPSYDQDDDESPSDSEVPDGSSFALSPDYNRQIHSLPAPPGQKELGNERSKSDMIPSYKNGLVLEMRENAPEEVTELWQILK